MTGDNETRLPSYWAVLPAEIRYAKDLNANEKLLYAEITALTNQTGICWASNSYFAEIYNCTPQAISKWIKNLEKFGYITIQYIMKNCTKEIEKRLISCVNIKTGGINGDLGGINNDIKGINDYLGGYQHTIKDNNINNNNINMNNNTLSEAQNSSSDTAKYDSENDILFSDSILDVYCSYITQYKIILNTGTWAYITTKYYKYLKELYPAVNIDQELKLMEAWCYNNKKKRKTKTGIKQFINTWLSKSQNTGNNAKYQSNNKVQSDYEKRRQLRTEDVVNTLSKSTPESFEFKDFDI